MNASPAIKSPNAQATGESVKSFGSLWIRTVPKATWTEYFLGAEPGRESPTCHWVADLSAFLAEFDATLVELDVFGDESLLEAMRAALAESVAADFPVSLLVDDGTRRYSSGGLLARAVVGVKVEPIWYQARKMGFRFEDDTAAYCYLGGLVPADATQDGAGQTRQVMLDIKGGLQAAGMGFRDVMRTWYYLDGILSWYDDFNRARTAFFKEHDVFSRLMPASTGIGIANASGKLVLAKVHAARPKNEGFAVRVAESPLQGSAYAYGSAFSRAVELTLPRGRLLHVSGTASIAPSGETEYLDDVAAQIRRTLDVVAGILQHAGMDGPDAVRGIAYFRHAKDLGLWEAVRQAFNLPPQAVIVVRADICRDDLLFELELEAAKA
ncbi:MAG: RidA family protein [Verrucomicrobia bacterium]|nr:RidA family protein [Verrucomicrobiota bacterium]